MFSFPYRLTKKRDIEITLKKGRRRRGTFCHLVVWRIDSGLFPLRGYQPYDLKIAVVVGKKVSKKATVRNKLKRQTREVFKEAIKEGKIKPGQFIVCLVQPSAAAMTFAELKQDIYALLSSRKS